LVSLVRNRHDQAGDSTLYDNWVEDIVAARCGEAVDLEAVALSSPPASQHLEAGSYPAYTFSLNNIGSARAFGTTWKGSFAGAIDSIGTATIVTSTGTAPCSVTGLEVVCAAPAPLAAGTTALVTMTVAAGAPGTISVVTEVSSHNPDLVPSNDHAGLQLMVECPSARTWDPSSRRCVANAVRAYVTTGASRLVTVIDVATNVVVAEIPAGNPPAGIAISADGRRVYVGNGFARSVSVIDTAANAVETTIDVGGFAFGVAVSPDGTRAYVTTDDADSLTVLDTTTNTVTAAVAAGDCPRGIGLSPTGAHAYVADACSDSISVIATATNTIVAAVPVPSLPTYVAVAPDGSRIYVGHQSSRASLSIIDATTNSLVSSEIFGRGGAGWLTVAPDGAVFLPIQGGMVEIGGFGRSFSGLVSGVAVTPDAGFAYAVGIGQNAEGLSISAVRVFERITGNLVATVPITTTGFGPLGGIAIGRIAL
jgi:YVTN family beta-propeller protein